MVSYINKFHPRNYRVIYVLCSTPGCGNTPQNIQINVFAAMLDAQKDNPQKTQQLTCNRCGKTTLYTHDSVQKIIPANLRPTPLPKDHLWAILLLELDTSTEMPERGFLGERLLIKLLTINQDQWTGMLLSESQFAPTLAIGATIIGLILNGYYVCLSLFQSNNNCPLPIEGVTKNSDIGTFFLPKKGATDRLQCSNLFCSNPSCAHIFGLLYSEFKEAVDRGKTTSRENQFDEFPLLLTCELCGVSKFIDESSFDNLFKI